MAVRRVGAFVCAAIVGVVFSASAFASDITISSAKSKLLIVHESNTPGHCVPGASEPCDGYAVSLAFTTTKGNQVEPGSDLVFETNELRFGPAGMCANPNSVAPVFTTNIIANALQRVGKSYLFSGVTTGSDGNAQVFPFVSVVFTPKGKGQNLTGGVYSATGSADFSSLTSGAVDVALVPVNESDATPDDDFNCVELTPAYQNEGF